MVARDRKPALAAMGKGAQGGWCISSLQGPREGPGDVRGHLGCWPRAPCGLVAVPGRAGRCALCSLPASRSPPTDRLCHPGAALPRTRPAQSSELPVLLAEAAPRTGPHTHHTHSHFVSQLFLGALLNFHVRAAKYSEGSVKGL